MRRYRLSLVSEYVVVGERSMHHSPLRRIIEAKVKTTAPLVLMVIVARRLIKTPKTIKNMTPRIATPNMIKGNKEYHQGIGGTMSIGFIYTHILHIEPCDDINIILYFRTVIYANGGNFPYRSTLILLFPKAHH